jgi:hypothetical protein
MEFVPVYVPLEHHRSVLAHMTSLMAIATQSYEWSEELLKRLYRDSAESTTKVLVALAEGAGTWMTTADIAPALGAGSTWRSVAGALNPLTKRQKAYGQERWPFELRQDPSTTHWAYRMSPHTAKIILREHRYVEDVIDEITRETDSE